MFDPSSQPRVFAVPLGVDFPKVLVSELTRRTCNQPPDALARVQLIVNTRRMARRIRTLFDEGPACLLPNISLITQPGETWNLGDIPEAVPSLRRRLELVQLVTALVERQPDLAPRSSVYDLADSLAGLMDEMHGEGVAPSQIDALDVSDQSGHWARIQTFLGIVRHYFSAETTPDSEARQRKVVEALITSWKLDPPQHPIVLAGSTGSRGTTQLLMKAIANLPQGAIVLPGFDFDMPSSVWSALLSSPPTEDHPQYRFAALLQDLGINNGDVGLWTDERPFEPERNKLVSLALRPAPVTDQWLKVGPELEAIDSATKDLTVLEAPSQRLEALAIAMRLRKAAEENQTIAVITPDRGLTRQIGAALDRWSILPDDSAGIPLHLSSPGRFLRHVSELLHKPLSAELLLTILKHPLTHSGSDRGPHLRLSRELELHLRRNGPPYPTPEALLTWAAGERDPLAKSWVDWIVKNFCLARETEQCDLTYLSRRHIDLAEAIARGSTADTDGELWKGDAGTEALDVVSELAESAQFGGDMRSVDYISLFYSMLSYRQVRSARDPHPNVMIWGTLEARVQGADVLILAGLNENSWPEAPSPDPWLNRDMRRQLGLLLPERRIGLSAHDFQQAIANKEVWLTRSVRSSDAETVPSRWLNRLKNLLGGLPGEIGPKSLAEMIERGDHWIEMAKSLETPIPSESALRPAPSPVPSARPKQLSVTQIKTLIRDPYAIYARHILGLRPLDSLMRVPDALLRGTVVHKALEDFIRETKHNIDDVTVARFVSHLSHWLEEHVPWAEARVMWEAKIAQVAERFVAGEQARRLVAQPSLLETKGRATLDDIGFSLTGEADRIDIDAAGHFHVYDYKTGVLPNKTVQKYFDKQLLLEAAIAEINGFGEMPPAPVARALFIGLGSGKSEEPAPLDEETPGQVWEEFRDLIRVYIASRQGFASRRAPQKMADEGDYDHLARFGEWDMTDTPRLIEVG